MTDRATVLFIDDEERILRSLGMLFRAEYRVLTTTDPDEALRMLAQERVDVIVSDQRMPAMRGVELLQRAREISPASMRLLLTGYSELEAIVRSVNEGEIFRFIHKPWHPQALKDTVRTAAEIARDQRVAEASQRAAYESPAAHTEGGIMVLDSDPRTSALVRSAMDNAVPVWAADNLDTALDILAARPVRVLVSEVEVDGEDISAILKAVKREVPNLVTLVATSFQDTNVLVDLINQGQIFRFLPKPLRRGMLALSLRSASAQAQRLEEVPVLRRRYAVDEAPAPKPTARAGNFLARLRARLETLNTGLAAERG